MGSSCSCNAKVTANEDRLKIYEPKTGVSLWYIKCREGVFVNLMVLLPLLTFDQLNRKEPNGSTCLHVACYRNHFMVVVTLLLCGCDRNVKNNYGLTPLQETTNDDIRQAFLFDRLQLQEVGSALFKHLEEDILAPNNKFILGHLSLENVIDAKKMMEAYRTTGIKKMYMNAEINSMTYLILRRIINRCIPSDHPSRSEATDCLDKEDPLALIRLYTLETDFYNYLQNDNTAFTANIFMNLAKFRNRAFKGRTYRGVKLAHFDVIAWKWATKKPGRIIELQTFISTSESEQEARKFATKPPQLKVSVLFILDFHQTCDTAIKLTEDPSKKIIGNLTVYPDEKEVLVTPYTLFQVNSVDFDETTQWYQIQLTHIPIGSQ